MTQTKISLPPQPPVEFVYGDRLCKKRDLKSHCYGKRSRIVFSADGLIEYCPCDTCKAAFIVTNYKPS